MLLLLLLLLLSLFALLVAMSGRVILGTNHQTASLLRAAVDRLDDIDQFLFVFQYPFDLVVVTGAEINHHVFISEEAVQPKIVSDCLATQNGDQAEVVLTT